MGAWGLCDLFGASTAGRAIQNPEGPRGPGARNTQSCPVLRSWPTALVALGGPPSLHQGLLPGSRTRKGHVWWTTRPNGVRQTRIHRAEPHVEAEPLLPNRCDQVKMRLDWTGEGRALQQGQVSWEDGNMNTGTTTWDDRGRGWRGAPARPGAKDCGRPRTPGERPRGGFPARASGMSQPRGPLGLGCRPPDQREGPSLSPASGVWRLAEGLGEDAPRQDPRGRGAAKPLRGRHRSQNKEPEKGDVAQPGDGDAAQEQVGQQSSGWMCCKGTYSLGRGRGAGGAHLPKRPTWQARASASAGPAACPEPVALGAAQAGGALEKATPEVKIA